MNGKKIAIVVMAGALIFSLERLIGQRSMVFEVGQPLSRCAIAVPHASLESTQLQEFANGAKVASVRAGYRQVTDVLAIVVQGAFRSFDGRSVGLRS